MDIPNTSHTRDHHFKGEAVTGLRVDERAAKVLLAFPISAIDPRGAGGQIFTHELQAVKEKNFPLSSSKLPQKR